MRISGSFWAALLGLALHRDLYLGSLFLDLLEKHVVAGFGGPGGRQSSKQGSAALAQQHSQL